MPWIDNAAQARAQILADMAAALPESTQRRDTPIHDTVGEEIASLRAEIAALRAELKPVASSLLIVGPVATEEFRRITAAHGEPGPAACIRRRP